MAFLKSIWKNNSKHQKLSEELALQNSKEAAADQQDTVETENDVVTFKIKYLGSTVVDKIMGDNVSAEAVKNILKAAKSGRKKLQRVNMAISLRGIIVTDLDGNDILKVSIYRISNCSTDPTHRQVFSFISTDSSETTECHAFICSKRKIAETVTLAVAHAFGTAFEAWKILPTTKELIEKQETPLKQIEKNNINHNAEYMRQETAENAAVEEKLIDFDDEPVVDNEIFDFGKSGRNSNSNHWVCFDDDFSVDTLTGFSKRDNIIAA